MESYICLCSGQASLFDTGMGQPLLQLVVLYSFGSSKVLKLFQLLLAAHRLALFLQQLLFCRGEVFKLFTLLLGREET